MTSLIERVSALLERQPVRRLELSRRGALLVELESVGQPRWVALEDQGARQIEPERDEDLPFASKLPGLRREQEAVVVGWHPGRRMVVRLRSAGAARDVAFVKALRTGRMRQTLERHIEGARAAREAGLGAAGVLSVEPDSASFALADLGDRRVRVVASSASRFERLGQALARFQAMAGGPELSQHGCAAELEVLDSLAVTAARVRGHLPARWETTRQVVGAALSSVARGPFVRTHRDLHDGQLLEHEDGVALLDFDLLCGADPALDPANFLAHLELRALQGLATDQGARTCAAAFRAGYGREGDAGLQRRMAAWGAATWLRLALVYHLRPPYATLGPVLVERAQTRLRDVRHGVP